MTSPRAVDVVVPVFNEGKSLHGFHSRLTNATEGLPYSFRFLYVNDGSGDNTMDLLADLRATDARVCPVNLSRNFGPQAALSAGLDACNADAVVMIDGDGEHPPSLMPEMLQLFESGYDIVHSAYRPRSRRIFSQEPRG